MRIPNKDTIFFSYWVSQKKIAAYLHSFESVNDSHFEFEHMHIVLAWDKFLAQKPSEFLISSVGHQQNNTFLPLRGSN